MNNTSVSTTMNLRVFQTSANLYLYYNSVQIFQVSAQEVFTLVLVGYLASSLLSTTKMFTSVVISPTRSRDQRALYGFFLPTASTCRNQLLGEPSLSPLVNVWRIGDCKVRDVKANACVAPLPKRGAGPTGVMRFCFTQVNDTHSFFVGVCFSACEIVFQSLAISDFFYIEFWLSVNFEHAGCF